MIRSRPKHRPVSMRLLQVRLLPLALVLLVTGGCGGSPPTATDTGPRPQLDIAEARTLLLAFRERGIELRSRAIDPGDLSAPPAGVRRPQVRSRLRTLCLWKRRVAA